ncbi:MAG: hypothetical protein Crog4KO_26430 [Crocinitomicaceae bacterium]
MTLSLSAQVVDDSITMQMNRTNESFYSMSNGEVANVNNTDWDIAFDLSGFGSSVRSNGHTGTNVWVYPNGTIWTSVDTTGMMWDDAYHNSESTWAVGAFDQDADPQNPFDIGWGEYNMVTHVIAGDRIFIVELGTGDFKKLIIEQLASGIYNFRHADLDGSNEVASSITKSDYTAKNFVYYSLTNDQIIDREPTNDSWDIVFTKYMGYLNPPGTFYNVTGVLSNNGVHVRQADGVDPTTADYTNFAVDSVIDVIGHDWKTFNGGTLSYDIAPDLSYFVEDLSGDLWHIVFTRFDLSSSGKVVFSKEKIASANVDEIKDLNAFGIYPNPGKDVATVIFDSDSKALLTISNMHGSIVHQESLSSGFVTHKLTLTKFQSGVYFVNLSTQNGSSSQKLIVQ